MIVDRLQNSKVLSLLKLSDLISSQGDLASFLTGDPRGLALPIYLEQLARSFKEERSSLLSEAEVLQENTSRVVEIVAAQRSHANVSRLVEVMDPRELIECAVRLSDSHLQKHGVVVVREYNPTEP